MDYQLHAIVEAGTGVNAGYDPNDDEISFGSADGVLWARFSDVIYHEYFHAVHNKIGGTPTRALMEGLADYFACTINNDSNYGENTTSYNNRQLVNNIVYDINAGIYVNGQSVSGACWDIREILGSTITDQLVFRALQINAKPTKISDFAENVKKADNQYYNSNYQNIIVSAFADHGIIVPVPSAPQVLTMSVITIDNVDYPKLSWGEYSEPDVVGYNIYRKRMSMMEQNFSKINSSLITTKQYIDSEIIANLNGGAAVEYFITAVDNYDYESTHSNYVLIGEGEGVWKLKGEDDEDALKTYSLSQAYPNPFNPTTQISYQITKSGFVSLVVYNTLGQEVTILVNQHQSSGKYSVQFTASSLPSGVYIYKLQSSEFSATKKMVLSK